MESIIPKNKNNISTKNKNVISNVGDVTGENSTNTPESNNLFNTETTVTEVTTKKIKKQRNKKPKRLTDHQVRVNHVTSEKKRREMIRSIYDDLVRLVPGLEVTENRSELIIYLKTMAYLKWLYSKNKKLRQQIKVHGGISEQDLIAKDLVWELDDDLDLSLLPQE